jgi:hypothetical protein
MEQMLAHLLAEIRTGQGPKKEEMLGKMETNQDRMMAKLDANHKNRKSRPQPMLYKEPGKDRHSGGGVGHNRNAITAYGTKAQESNYI